MDETPKKNSEEPDRVELDRLISLQPELNRLAAEHRL